MTIRLASTTDVPAMVTMGARFLAGSPYGAVFAYSPAQMTILATHLVTADGAAVLVAEDASGIVGMLGLIVAPHFISGEQIAGEVFWWMNPEARGAGLRLFRAAEAWAKGRGAVAMQMIAPNDRVGTVYERNGYQPIERTYVRRFDAA